MHEGDYLEHVLDSFLEEKGQSGFRDLYYEAAGKPRYLPGKSQFLKCADEDYMETNSEVNTLKIFLRTRYASSLKTPGEYEGLPDENILDDLIWDIRDAISSNNADRCMEQDMGFVQEVFNVLRAMVLNLWQ